MTDVEPLPETRFARSGPVNIAYQVMGDRPLGLLIVPGMISHIEVMHEIPAYTGFLVPTLVLHRERDSLVPVALGRYYAEHIPGARLALYPSSGHWPPTFDEDWDTICDDIQEFVTGTRGEGDAHVDRVLATVLFTDIVDSTRQAAELGDARWRARLDEHDRIVGRAIEQYRGRLIKRTGDGVLATFDGPGRAIRCAMAIGTALAPLQIAVRAGLHTGEVELREDDVGGIAVHVAARVMQAAGPGEVMVSRVVSDLVAGSGIGFADRGEVALKGLEGKWRLLAASPISAA